MKPYIKEYSPKKESEVIGQKEALARLKDFLVNFKKQKKKAALLYGSTGIGKTSSLYALANDLNLEVIELNASDLRNKDSIHSVLGAASKQMSLFMRQKAILVDEVDGIAGREDYGGLAEITNLIDTTSFPIIITANNPYDSKFSTLRRKTEMIQFKEPEAGEIAELLKKICDKEKIQYSEDALKTIARRNGGDIRAAINDLQIISADGKVTRESLEELSGRDKTESMLQALVKVFKSRDTAIALTAFDNVEEDVNQQMLWLDENIPYEYKSPADLARAYDCMSRADVFLGRISRWQHWRFIVYAENLISAGIAVAKDDKNPGFVKYKPTGRILKLWIAKQKNLKKKAIAEKIGARTHSSSKEVVQEMPYYKEMFKDKKMAEKLSKEFDLNTEEIDWMKRL